MKWAIVSFTSYGKKVEEEIINEFKGKVDFSVYRKEDISLKEFVAKEFIHSKAIIFIGAMGIAVRFIAPHIKSKDTDPAVIVIDDGKNFVIPLLSGHLGGSNQLALDLSQVLHSTPVITTSTDVNNVFAIDLWTKKNNIKIKDISKIKKVSSALIEGKEVAFSSDFKIVEPLPKGFVLEENLESKNNLFKVHIGYKKKKDFDGFLGIKKAVTLGVGARRNTDSQIFENRILEVLDDHNIDLDSLEKIVSIDLKKDEQCILDFSEKYNIPFYTYNKDQLNQVRGDFSSSDFVKKTVGVDCVCERSALVGDEDKKFIFKKIGGCGITLAASLKDWECKF